MHQMRNRLDEMNEKSVEKVAEIEMEEEGNKQLRQKIMKYNK